MAFVPSPFIDATGLNIPTYTEVFNGLVNGEQSIFGLDTNYDTNSPDGQRVGIAAQCLTDNNETLQSLFNSFFAQYAIGNSLDLCVARKGITRNPGTFSTVSISIIANAVCTLQGLDNNINNVNGVGYTVQDNVGNKWILTTTTTLDANTTTSLIFRASNYGNVITSPNTITIPVTVVVGVVSLTNPGDVLVVGTNEETDTELRARYFQSFANTSGNQVDTIYSALLNLSGVTDVLTQSNNTSTTDIYGTPAFTLWTIVEGGNNNAIANIIYNNISGGGMRGAVIVNVPSINQLTTININFDRPIYIVLYIKFNLKKTNPNFIFDIPGIQSYMAKNAKYKLGGNADSGTLTCLALNAINFLGGGGVPLDLLVSNDNMTWVDYLSVGILQNKFTLSSTNIAITVV